MKPCLESQLVREIQVFWDLKNFYRRFIKNFNRIAALFIFMLQITNKSTGGKL